MEPTEMRKVFAPGRVNLIGDHTDYTGGLVFPFAIDRGITIIGRSGGSLVALRSSAEDQAAEIELPVHDPAGVRPEWARLIAGVAAEMNATIGFAGSVESNLPVGGLSSSAAVEVATALMLGHDGTPRDLAELCQRAEHRAIGVPCGIMDQLTSAAGVAGAALLIDCHTMHVVPYPIPDDVEIVVVHSGEHRALVDTAYATRRAECEAAEAVVGPLREATLRQLDALEDPVLRARANHVVSENRRVRDFAASISSGDFKSSGQLMRESHESLRADFAVSTSTLDSLVSSLTAQPGVYGARLTGAGFGGAVVALCQPGALDSGFVVRPSAGAQILCKG